jgi:hypothetical protein
LTIRFFLYLSVVALSFFFHCQSDGVVIFNTTSNEQFNGLIFEDQVLLLCYLACLFWSQVLKGNLHYLRSGVIIYIAVLQYLEISSQLPSVPNIYGLGEHVRKLRLDADGRQKTTNEKTKYSCIE